jgi:hypothetical protein
MYTNPTGSGAAATYGALEIFSATESLPLIITGKKIAEIPIAELLP